MLWMRRVASLVGGSLLLASSLVLADEVSCGKSRIDKVELVTPNKGLYEVQVDYCYEPDTKEPVFLALVLDGPDGFSVTADSLPHEAMPGQHSARVQLTRPHEPEGPFSTHKLSAQISEGPRLVAFQRQDLLIEWPSMSAYQHRRFYAQHTNDELLKFAEANIDEGSPAALRTARGYLEKIVLEEPERVEVYKQFARIAMAQQQGDQGSMEAQKHLNTALQIDPQYTDGYIIRGFVLSSLSRFDEAEADFRKAESLGAKNLWLWNNWARKHFLQGDKAAAVRLYRRTLSGERPQGRNLRARLNAFENLLYLLDDDLHAEDLEALHVQRLREFDNQPCLYTEYAIFLLRVRQDYKQAIANGHQALDGGCQNESARAVLGVAYYLGSVEQPALLGRARIFMPEGPRLYWEFARLPQGEPLLQRYREQVDIPDANGYTALAMALEAGDIDAAKRLRGFGADIKREIGKQKIPLPLLPILHGRVEGVRFLIEQGVDYSLIRYRGIAAEQYAEQVGDTEISGLLQRERKI